ncbi:MAG: serine hydroxymethyltransferase [Patescibacteria group bacterium]
MYDYIKKQDEEVFKTLEGEETREREGIELIPSENYVSRAVREAQGSIFTNKYSEGYPGKRYYGGQPYTDEVENIAIDRAKKLFNAGFANVQPHSGSNANVAMYMALLQPGDTVLGMDLSHGGHLTHGHPVTYITKFFNFVRYKMKDVETGEIDYDEMRRVAIETKPKIVLAGFSAYPRELDYEKFASIAKEVGAYAVMDAAHIAGLIAGGVAKNPFDYGFDVITTTTHKTLRGPRGGLILTRESEDIAKRIDKAVFPGFQGGPLMHVVAAKAVAFKEALDPSFKTYAGQILKNMKAMEAVLHERGVRMITGGTSNHLILADAFGSLGVSGKEAQALLDTVGMTLNMNSIADDTRGPMDPSGIRFGSAAITTRGFKEKECAQVANLLIDALQNRNDQAKLNSIHEEIKKLCAAFPIPDSFI